jgi:hypothetical protein
VIIYSYADPPPTKDEIDSGISHPLDCSFFCPSFGYK